MESGSIELSAQWLIFISRYSESARRKGFNLRHAAHIFKILMSRLGHKKFYVHGSDWGALTATTLATMFPQNIMGFHSNFCLSPQRKTLVRYLIGALWPSLFFEEEFIKTIYPPLKWVLHIISESAYFHSFATKPDTIGKFN